MAVVLLSKIIITPLPLLYKLSIRGVIPEWKKVESPIIDTIFPFNFGFAFSIPKAWPTPAPIQRQLSRLLSGGRTASV